MVKRFLIRLKHTSLYNELLSNWHFVLLFILLGLILYRFKSIVILICLCVYCWYLIKTNYRMILVSLILLFIMVIKLGIYDYQFNQRYLGEYHGYGQISKIKQNDYGNQYVVKTDYGKYLCFIKKDQAIFQVGDLVLIKGVMQDVDRAHVPYGFDYQKYLKDLKIYGQMAITKISLVKHQFTLEAIKYYLEEYYNQNFSPKSAAVLKALIMGSSDAFTADIKSQINQIGISHLFVVSGLHVSVFIMLLTRLLKLLKVKEKFHSLIIIPLLFGYLVIMHFMVSIIRVFISEVLKRQNQKYHLSLTTIDRFALNIIIILLINPSFVFQMGFILSYLISGTLIISSKLIDAKQLGFWRSSLIMCFISLFISLPVVAWLDPDVNLLSIIINLVYIPFVSFVLLPLSLVVTLLPYLDFFYLWIVIPFLNITSFLSRIKGGIVSFPHPSWLIIVMYYSTFWYLMAGFEERSLYKAKKGMALFWLVLIVWHQKAWFNLNDEVMFLDLPQGEATLIRSRFNQLNILIDTGEAGYEEIQVLLKKLGIQRIDYLIISHGDSDHSGEGLNIMNNFTVKTLVVSKYDESLGILKLLQGRRKATWFLEAGDYFHAKGNTFTILHPTKTYQSTNDNSLVIYAQVFGKTFLFTGDIENRAEKDLVAQFSSIEVDYLKVAHHGSLTSTTPTFLNHVHYQQAIIMSGYRNPFGFPHPLTLQKLKPNVWDTKAKQTLIIRRKFYEKVIN